MKVNGIDPDRELLDLMNATSEDWFVSGSRFVCNPPVEDTDVDFFLYASGSYNSIKYVMDKAGFEFGGSTLLPFCTTWESYRKDDINLIYMWDVREYSRKAAATLLAKTVNILDKDERIALFDRVQTSQGLSL